MNFDFGEVLGRAWQITWKHKNLWLAGIIIGLIGLVPALISLPFSSSFFSFNDPSQIDRQMPAFFLMNAVMILLSLLSIPIYVIAMSIPSLGTLQLEKSSETLSFAELTRGTLPYFWRVLGVLLLVGAGMVAAMFAFMVCDIVISAVTFGFGSLCLFPIIIPLAILAFSLMEQGLAAVLVDNLGVTQALQRAWDLVKKNLLTMGLMSIIIYLGSMIVSMILSVPMMIPMFGYMNNIMQSMGSEPDPQSFERMFRSMMWWMLVFSPFYAVFQGVLLTFMQSAWTLTYLRLTRGTQLQPLPVEATS